MRFDPKLVQELVFGGPSARRFTQDSPILPDVWRQFADAPGEPVDLLLTPHNKASAARIGHRLREDVARGRRRSGRGDAQVAYTQFVVAELYFDEVVRWVLPMTSWWRRRVQYRGHHLYQTYIRTADGRGRLEALLRDFLDGQRVHSLTAELLWTSATVGALSWAQGCCDDPAQAQDDDPGTLRRPSTADMVEGLRTPFQAWFDAGLLPDPEAVAGHGAKLLTEDGPSAVWQVNRNRTATNAVTSSVLSVKADAAVQLFEISCKDIAWAIVDSGIDASHPAFCTPWPGPHGVAKPVNGADPAEEPPWWERTRVVRTLDFTRIRRLLNPSTIRRRSDLPQEVKEALERDPELEDELIDLRRNLKRGRQVDWGILAPFLEIPHDESYGERHRPLSEHGTHVAGILGAWGTQEGDRRPTSGVCPDIRLYDLRVLGPPDRRRRDLPAGSAGAGDEFAVLAALQYLSYLNAHKDYLVVHGANLSLSIRHQVESFACGATPICEEADRLMASGVVVVAAAGNLGFHKFETKDGYREGYLPLSITDPGNAQKVITVGATHRSSPHTYGVSYFSSRGPTGDGRLKPDLVAPGEKITAPVPGGDWEAKDGTSMAAPHVSGAAALLMARHTELMGKGQRIKDILCETATDLGRERYFQGRGMVDVLRALQSV
ncbi:MAG: S8 family serine peptidase [Acidobacteriota bacterium]